MTCFVGKKGNVKENNKIKIHMFKNNLSQEMAKTGGRESGFYK